MVASHHLLVAQLLSGLTSAVNLYASHYSGTVNLLSFDGSSSLKLTTALKTCGGLPSWLTYDAAGKSLYCSDETMTGSASVSSYSIGADGTLTQTGKATTPAGGVANVLYGGSDGTGFIATAHYQSSQISTFKLPLSSSSQPLQTLKFTLTGRGTIPSRQDASHPHEVLVDPTGDYLLSPDLGADLIRIYSIDKSSGKLTECPAFAVKGGTGPRHGVFWSPPAANASRLRGRANGAAPAGTVLFIANELANTVSAHAVSYSGSCLTLTQKQTLTPYANNKAAPSGTKVAEVRVAGSFLYSSNRNDKTFSGNDSMAQFSIAPDGTLTYVADTSSYGTYPRTFQINKAGTFIAIGDQTTANVAIVPRDPATGKLGASVANLRIGTAGTPENEDGLSSVVWAE